MISQYFIKGSKPEDLIVQFSTLDLPKVLNQFQKILKQQKITIRKAKMPQNVINFYITDKETKRKAIQYQGIIMQSLSNFKFQLCIIYLWNKQLEELGISLSNQKLFCKQYQKPKRFLIIRQGMEKIFSVDYQIQETISQKQTGIFLCKLSAFMINNLYDQKLSFYDQKVNTLPSDKQKSMYANLWKNVLYQIPGLGKQKIQCIIKKYPTFYSLANDYYAQRKLANLQLSRAGGKTVKLGAVLANRIYQVLNSVKFKQSVV